MLNFVKDMVDLTYDDRETVSTKEGLVITICGTQWLFL